MFGYAASDQNETERRTGDQRRSGAERRNGFAVLLAGCPECGRIAQSPADMHTEGWLIVADDEGITLIACPEHRAQYEPGAQPAGPTEVTY
jgi:hypothetical protein